MYDDYESPSRKNRRPKGRAARAECPFCFNNVTVGTHPRIGQQIRCPSCKTDLEVVWLSPLELDSPIQDEYDEFEDDDFFDDFDDEDY